MLFEDSPNVFGYWWARRNDDWMLIYFDTDGFAHYGNVSYELELFNRWTKANFYSELQELYRNSWRFVE